MALIPHFALTSLAWTYHYILPFVVVLSILVFVHEFGHYWVARRCGVKIDAFSIGFGPEIFGWTDSAGTRWRIALIPMGGFVKMFGDADASSRPDIEAAAQMDAETRRVSFMHKKLWQKSLVVSAGPVANFLFAILVMTVLFATVGQPFTPPIIGKIQPGSAAEHAGLMTGDVVQSVDGREVRRFEELKLLVTLAPGQPIKLNILRNGQPLELVATPAVVDERDRFGNVERMGQLGVYPSSELVMRHEGPPTALWQATRETWSITSNTLGVVWQMIIGTRGTGDLSGPIGIAQMSGEFWREGFVPLTQFVALLSISLGLINLFPIPVLDGGHLLFYAIEAVHGRPVSERALAFGFRVGFALILSFFIFVMWQDIARIIPGT
ncbi:MAG TPA: RIP metalloprotease RseP [Alphaproteobacteria bacterium]|nr:RIP metalloprotease RseP [Alphaproteobacteria bacterium]